MEISQYPKIFFLFILLGMLFCAEAKLNCDGLVSNELKEEIKGYKATAQKIYDAVLSGPFKGRTYNNLAVFVDKFGNRRSGTDNLERSIDFAMSKMREDGFVNVEDEEVNAPNWIRGQEKATLVSHNNRELKLLGLGLSMGTPPEGIIAPVIVVKTFDELAARASEVKGKIVVFDQDVADSYDSAMKYRVHGAVKTAKLGAVACLMRSVTKFSIRSPHTGYLEYEEGTEKIPSAALTVEDAAFLHRLESRGEKMAMHLILDNKMGEPKKSRNSWGDNVGREKPDNIVLVSCHIDSWDVGDGSMDDAGGCYVGLEALNVLRHLNLIPRRTLRAILFTAEEPNLVGARQYAEKHVEEMGRINAIMESDFGTFRPEGLNVAGADSTACIVQEIASLLEPVNATSVQHRATTGADTVPFLEKGVPGITLRTDDDKYLWFHHTEGDTLSVETPEELDLCTAAWAVATYVVADLSVDLPRKQTKMRRLSSVGTRHRILRQEILRQEIPDRKYYDVEYSDRKYCDI